ncbi:MAG: alpha-mannosidase [Planctomycetota bacterium]
MAKRKIAVHYVASTHWDREWYKSFQGFRFMLVKLVDRLLDLLENDAAYEYFVFDGQTVALADYLEVRPENRARLEALVKSGRMLVGPWYAMPDERLVSGEALIRNLMLGYRDSRALGAQPMRYGYVCDIFGHIAQMPQIFAGMGIDYALVGRGTNEHTHPAHMIWRAPDGSEVLTFKEQDRGGYGSGRWIWKAAGGAEGKGFDKENILKAARDLLEEEGGRSDVPLQLWVDGLDHQRPGPRIPEALEVIRAGLPEVDLVFSHFLKFAEDQEKYRGDLPVFEGELIDVAKAGENDFLYLISHCLSSYYPMKSANDDCQALLENWAEPYLVWAGLRGAAPATRFLEIAWEFLIKNHAHDSICGCSIDQVHKDTEYRYDQCRMIAREVLDDCLATLGPAPEEGADALTLTAFSAVPRSVKKVVTAKFDYPADFPVRRLVGFSDDRVPCFDLLDEKGGHVPYQMHRYIAPEPWQGLPSYRAEAEGKVRVMLSFEAEFDGIGARDFTVIPRERPYRDLGTQITGPQAMENEHLRVEVRPDGTIDVTNKADGRRFEGLCLFEDTGEIGDGWYHVEPVDNQTFMSSGFPTGVSILEDGSLLTTFRIEKTLMLPAAADWGQLRRSTERTSVNLTLDVTLRKGARQVDCRAILQNTARDHRLRVLFPTGVKGAEYFADQPFAFVTRKRGVDRTTFDWKESDVEERNFHGVVGVADAGGGLAVIAGTGLHEVAVKDDEAGTIAVTLIRAFKRTVRPPATGRAQLQQAMEFAWQIVPFHGKPDLLALAGMKRELDTGIEFRAVRGRGKSGGTFARLSKGLAMPSALKPGADGEGVVVRLYNPTDTTIEDVLEFDRPVKSAVEVNHAEEPLEGADERKGEGALTVTLPAYKIRTWRLRF